MRDYQLQNRDLEQGGRCFTLINEQERTQVLVGCSFLCNSIRIDSLLNV